MHEGEPLVLRRFLIAVEGQDLAIVCGKLRSAERFRQDGRASMVAQEATAGLNVQTPNRPFSRESTIECSQAGPSRPGWPRRL